MDNSTPDLVLSKRAFLNKIRGNRKRLSSKKEYVQMYESINENIEKYESLIKKEEEAVSRKAKHNLANIQKYEHTLDRIKDLRYFVCANHRRTPFKKRGMPKFGDFYKVSSLPTKTHDNIFNTLPTEYVGLVHYNTILSLHNTGVFWNNRKKPYAYFKPHFTDPVLPDLAERVKELYTRTKIPPYAKADMENLISEVRGLAALEDISYDEVFTENLKSLVRYIRVCDDVLRDHLFEEFNGPSVLVELFNGAFKKIYSEKDTQLAVTIRLPFLDFAKAGVIEPPVTKYFLLMDKKTRCYSLQVASDTLKEQYEVVHTFEGCPSDKNDVYKIILERKHGAAAPLGGCWVDITSKQYKEIVDFFESKSTNLKPTR